MILISVAAKDMAPVVVCALDARKYLANENCNTGDYIDGFATLTMISDTDYLFHFESSRKSENVVADLDDIGSFGENLFTVSTKDDIHTYAIIDDVEYSLFVEAVQECQIIVDIAFRLDCLMRDRYHAGIHSPIAEKGDDELKIEDIRDVQNQQLSTTAFKLFDPSLLQRQKTSIVGDLESVSEDIDSSAFRDDVSNINCIFCGAQKTMERTKRFFCHPYVPVDSNNKFVYMCYSCICNWKEYRERAVTDSNLMMMDETNEELCGICSDTPPELIMCSHCPRSFCVTCLTRVLTSKQVLDLDKPQDWLCMCCTYRVRAEPPSLISSDWRLVLPSIVIKKKSRCVIEKQSVPEFHEDFIEEVPTCLESYFLDDNMEEDNFSDEITYNDSSDDEVTSEEKEVVVMCISPQGITVVEEIACEAVHRTDGSGASEFMSAVVSQEEYEEDMVITPNPLSEPQRESGMSIPTEQVQRESPGCAEWPSDITPVCPSGPAHTIEDEILSIFADRAIIAAASDASSSVLTPLEDVRLSEIPVAVRSPVRSPVIPVSEATHYFSQYLETHSNGMEPGKKEGYPTDDVCFLCKDGGSLVECDFVHRDNRLKRRCQKVYHTHCLLFKIEASVKYWRCPRHFCDYCGTPRVKHMCRYCPMSVCAKCSEPDSGKIMLTSRNTQETEKFSGSIQTIVCNSCLEMTEKCLGLTDIAVEEGTEGVEAVETAAAVTAAVTLTATIENRNTSDCDSITNHAASLLDLRPDSRTHSLPSTSTSIAITSSSSSSSSDLQKKRPKKDGTQLLKSIQKTDSRLNKNEGTKSKTAEKVKKKAIQMEMTKKNKETNTTIEKRRVGRPCKIKNNVGIGFNAAIIEKHEGKDASSSPPPSSSLPSPSPSVSPVRLEVIFQARIGKRKRDSWLSDSECSAGPECNVL